MKLKLLLASSLFAVMMSESIAQYLKNENYVNATGVSNNGLVVIYNEYAGPIYLWNSKTDITDDLGGTAPGNGYGGLMKFSDDGKYISGSSIVEGSGNIGEMSRYDSSTNKWNTLGRLGYINGVTAGAGYSISGNGKIVVGNSYDSITKKGVGAVWSGNTKLTNLGTMVAKRASRALDVNHDGSVIAGGQDIGGPYKAIVWRKNGTENYDAGSYLMIDPSQGNTSNNLLGEARAVSGDGKLIGGGGAFISSYSSDAWLWNEKDGAIILKNTIIEANVTKGYVTGINHDGTIAVGFIAYSDKFDDAPQNIGFIWTKEGGMKDLNVLVADELKYDLAGDAIQGANDISSNGKYITGVSHMANRPKYHTFLLELPDNFLSTQQQTVKTNEVKLYPNPVTDYLNIDSKDKIEAVKIYNTVGQLVAQPKVSNNKVNLTNLNTGVYNVNITTVSGTKTYKVIKK